MDRLDEITMDANSLYRLYGPNGRDLVPDLGNAVLARWNDPSLFDRSRLKASLH